MPSSEDAGKQEHGKEAMDSSVSKGAEGKTCKRPLRRSHQETYGCRSLLQG